MRSLVPAKKKNAPTVTQHNALIRANYDYSLREIRTARLITSKINPMGTYKEGQGILLEIKPSEAKSIYSEEGKAFKDLWGVFERTILSLNSKPLQIDSDRITGHINFTSSVYKDKVTGHFYVRTTPEITPFLVALHKGQFTTIPLQIYSQFKSKYLTRLYEQLYSNRSMRGGVKKYRLWTDLAQLCGWSGKKYSHFKNRVLVEGQQKFPSFTPLSFKFEEIKKQGSKAVEGLVFTITTQKPATETNPPLFPQMSMRQLETIEEIRSQLVSWSVNHLTIEKLIEDPFQYIDDETIKAKVGQHYTKLNYLWEKMEYVVRAKSVKDEAKYLMMAIKNNYKDKAQTKAKEETKKKKSDEGQQAELASIENSIRIVRNEATIRRGDMAASVLEENPKLMEVLFTTAARKYRYEESLDDLKNQFHKKGIFRYHIIQQITERFPKLFEVIDTKEKEQLQALEQQKRVVKQRK